MKIKDQYTKLKIGFKGANGMSLGELNPTQLKTLSEIAIASKDQTLLQLFETLPVDTKTEDVLTKLNSLNSGTTATDDKIKDKD